MNRHHENKAGGASGGNPYIRLAIMAMASFVAMYGLMYAMVDRFSNVFPSLNQAYMAGLMAAPMVTIELLVMRSMYPNRTVNAALVAASVVLLGFFWLSIRAQAAITDREFLKSMIPHHGGAILMCQETSLRDPELDRLCREIVASQQREIDFMKSKLRQTAAR
jgi:uncharacterized protein (DUF305 family)